MSFVQTPGIDNLFFKRQRTVEHGQKDVVVKACQQEFGRRVDIQKQIISVISEEKRQNQGSSLQIRGQGIRTGMYIKSISSKMIQRVLMARFRVEV
jgi:hypothetical protein